MVEYCENSTTCRHLFLMKYFDTLETGFKPNLQEICPNRNCDVCLDPNKVKKSLWTHLNYQTVHETAFTEKRKHDTSVDIEHEGNGVKFQGFQKASDLNKPAFKKANFFRSALKETQSQKIGDNRE